jgi:putative tryptophan/tyrosine transport system ATP-binding protein
MELNVTNLNKSYRGFDSADGFSLEIPVLNLQVGQLIFIMGRNGSGKSMLVKLLAGELLPSSGAVQFTFGDRTWGAHEQFSPVVRQRAEESLALDLTVQENILIHYHDNHLIDLIFPKRRLREKANQLLVHFPELRKKTHQSCHELSGGQKQALAFVLATSQKSFILLLDEFLSALDNSVSLLIRCKLKEYTRSFSVCSFIVSHDIDVALEDADRILLLQKGRLIHDIDRNSEGWNYKSIRNLLEDD